MTSVPATAGFGGRVGVGLTEVREDLSVLDTSGKWVVAVSFEGRVVCARFDHWATDAAERNWPGVGGAWRTSLKQEAYEQAVAAIREDVARGWVYQANLCRVLRAPTHASSVVGLSGRLPHTPFSGYLHLPDHDVSIACASPERLLSRQGDRLTSSPIKGTSRTVDGFLAKDFSENVMIVDLVRNDLGHVAVPGSVGVPRLLEVEPYPGLHHLVSTVTATMRPGVSWTEVAAAMFPAGSISGAPKSSALEVIGRLEPEPRQWYCGAFGWVDADRRRAELAVAIRTFWLDGGDLCFGTGAGITWGSDPVGEWEETELKALGLIELASR